MLGYSDYFATFSFNVAKGQENYWDKSERYGTNLSLAIYLMTLGESIYRGYFQTMCRQHCQRWMVWIPNAKFTPKSALPTLDFLIVKRWW